MKRRIMKVVVALLVFAFVIGIAPTSVISDLFNSKVSAAQQYNLRYVNGKWLYYNDNGVYDPSYVGVVQNQHGWWYVKNGTVDFKFNGMAYNQYGWWYLRNGKVDFKYTGMAYNYAGWWYFKDGRVDFNYTGMANNSNGWWYFKDGRVDFNYTGLAQNQYGWWYFINGRIDFNYNGLVTNQYGTWYVNKGKVNFSYNGVAKDKYGIWWNVKNGKVVSRGVDPNSEAQKEAGTLGFLWNDTDEVFYSASDPWQRNWGYNAFYDYAAQYIVLYYDTLRVKFNYGGYDWLVQLWKGQYGFVLLGAELGVYYKDENSTVEHYKCDDNSKMLKAGYVCYDHDEVLFSREYQDTWWLTGFVPGKLDRFDDRSEMALEIMISFKTWQMRNQFIYALEDKGFTRGTGKLEEPDTYYVASEKTVYLSWRYIKDKVGLMG